MYHIVLSIICDMISGPPPPPPPPPPVSGHIPAMRINTAEVRRSKSQK